MRTIFFYSKLFQCVLVQGLRFEHTKNIDILIQWFLRRSQRHQSYFHLVSYFNHFHLQEGVTFCINELHVSFADMMYRKKKLGCELFQWLSRWFTNGWIQTPGERKSSHVLIYKGEEKYSRGVFMWWTFNMKTLTSYYYATEYFYCIYLIRYFDYHRNKASIEQIYNITAYTDI